MFMMEQQKMAKSAVRQRLNQVNILPFLKDFQKSTINDIRSQASSIYERYFGKFSDVSRWSYEESEDDQDGQEEEDDQDDEDEGGSQLM